LFPLRNNLSRHALVACAAAALVGLSACATYRPGLVTESQEALPAATAGPIADVAERLGSRLQADESALWLLPTSRDAFLSRVALIDAATTSLDIQYFIWQDDWSGQFLLERLLQAADRGVRVRFLIDDVRDRIGTFEVRFSDFDLRDAGVVPANNRAGFGGKVR